MILGINTIKDNNTKIEIMLFDGDKILAVKTIKAEYRQAEKLLPSIDKMVRSLGKEIGEIREIRVVNRGGSFTSLRIGVVTANALGYALGIPVYPWGENSEKKKNKRISGFSTVNAEYEAEPNITVGKKKF